MPPSMWTPDTNKEEDEIMALFESYERRIDKINGVLIYVTEKLVADWRKLCFGVS